MSETQQKKKILQELARSTEKRPDRELRGSSPYRLELVLTHRGRGAVCKLRIITGQALATWGGDTGSWKQPEQK